jgi:DNA repair protein RecN (Recombination protein N)
MLQKLIIRNYAIIDNLSIEPDVHLNTVTGETGAGKSIILGALSLILGERADTTVLINKAEKCVVEAHFDVKNNKSFLKALKKEELDEEEQCIIRREISTSGKTRAFINDTPVTLNILNKLTSLLVDLHQQFGHLALEDDNFQLDVIDAIAKNGDNLKQYQELFGKYRKLSKELSEQQARQAQWQKESDYKQFQYDELAQASFKQNEIEDAEQQLKQLNHSERILNVLQAARIAMEEGEQPIVNEVRRITQQLQTISELVKEVEPLQERLASAHAELKDIAGELEQVEAKVNLDPALMLTLQERVDLGYKLCKKHGVQTTNELLEISTGLEKELQETLNLNDHIEQLTKEQEQLYKAVKAQAEKLSAKRKETAPAIAAKVNELLKLVGMPNALLKIELTSIAQPDSYGMDEVSFLLDANKTGNFLPVYKAASGGEMSRIMLCIKSLTARAMHLPTLIFDEVDTGISGEAARQVGMLLRDLASYHQVICITHQPQVAAKGSRHFFVYKELDKANKITTNVRVLQEDERVLAIARMIGGEAPSDAALQNARELVA